MRRLKKKPRRTSSLDRRIWAQAPWAERLRERPDRLEALHEVFAWYGVDTGLTREATGPLREWPRCAGRKDRRYRACRRLAVIRSYGNWYCAKCIRSQPLPLDVAAEHLEYRPHDEDYRRFGDFALDEMPKNLPYFHRQMSWERADITVAQACRMLEVTKEQLWALMAKAQLAVATGGTWRVATVWEVTNTRGAEEDHTREPYRFTEAAIEDCMKRLVADAARRLGAGTRVDPSGPVEL